MLWCGGLMAIAGRSAALLAGVVVFASTLGAAELASREVTIVSEGVPIYGAVYQPAASTQGGALPAVIMSHGWGGTAAMLEQQARDIAAAGYFVLVIDYRGWGRSAARPVLAPNSGEVREVVDPLEQATDVLNAIHWVMAEPGVDPQRVGLWGTSFSGGLMVYAAVRDPRIRAVVAQVAWFGQRVADLPPQQRAAMYAEASRRARGETGYPPPGARVVGNLRGGPVAEKFLRYAPIADIGQLQRCALLVIDAENEELFDRRGQGENIAKLAPEPKAYHVIPGVRHYAIYNEAREQATRLAIDWFDRYLKSP
jgi:dienelactone hydrolase